MRYKIKGSTGRWLVAHEDTDTGCKIKWTDKPEEAGVFAKSRVSHILSDMRPARPPMGTCEAVEA